MRENRTYGSEGGEGGTLSLPLSSVPTALSRITGRAGLLEQEKSRWEH
jgi:hypothetical protein